MKRKIVIGIAIMLAVLSGCGVNADQTNASVENKNETIEASSITPTDDVAKETKKSNGPAKKAADYIVTETIVSEAIAKNIVEEPTERTFYVCLPPSYYDDNDKSYPVVYYLHGQAESVSSFKDSHFSELFRVFENGAKEFILVCADGYSNMGGAFYVNSPVSGNWEDYVVDEVTSFIDQKYRTIAQRDSRGICGFSMGGFGAYNLAFRHPDTYSCVLAMSPGALADGDIESAMETWKYDTHFLIGYGRAFSPNVDAEDENYANIPTMDNSAADQKIVEDWYNGFGNINQKLDDYLALNKPLKAIKIIYGETDSYDWIPNGCKFLAQCMDERNIDYVMGTHKLGHILPVGAEENEIVPFFNDNLIY